LIREDLSYQYLSLFPNLTLPKHDHEDDSLHAPTPSTSSTNLPTMDSEFRLCHIQPDDQGSPIHCTLTTYHDKPPANFCLSYTWASNEATETINLDGKPTRISKSLHQALLQLRSEGFEKPIWIDALCFFDQAEKFEAERWRYVTAFGKILKEAEEVVVWLGTPFIVGQG
jgi:hypothetical protein